MKTLTEFPSATIKNATKIRQELITSGKTPEELPAALGEALKLEGDKLNRLMNALEATGSHHLNDLKRVVVYLPAEVEKAPEGTVQKGEHLYLVEYYTVPAQKIPETKSPRDRGNRGKGDQNRGKGGGGAPRSANAPKAPQQGGPAPKIIPKH